MYVPGARVQPASCGSVIFDGPANAREPGYLDTIAKALIILNLLDAVFTLYWIRAGLAVEVNALMRDLVVENAMGFVLVKLTLVSLGSFWLLRFHHHKLVAAGLMASLVIYLLVVLHHLRFSGWLLLSSLY